MSAPVSLSRVLLLLAPLAAAASCSINDCSTRNDSDDALRRVPVAVAAASPDGSLGDAGGRVEYTIDASSGEFTLTRREETESGFLGLRLDVIDKDAAQDLDLEPFVGVRVRKVEAGTPAADGGVLRGDVILKYGAKDAVSPDQLAHLIEATKPGDPVELSLRRGGKTLQMTVLVGSERRFETKKALRMKLRVLDDRRRTGLRLAQLPDDVWRSVVGPAVPEKGLLVVDVLPGGPGFYADLRPRDHVARVGEAAVPTIDAYLQAMESTPAGSSAPFSFDRSGRRLETIVDISADALDEDRFDFPLILKYSDKPDHTELELILGILYGHESCRSVRIDGGTPRNVTTTKWGVILDLLRYESSSRGKKELRIGWVLPIRWGG